MRRSMGLNSVSLKVVSTFSMALILSSTVVAELIALSAAISLFDFGFCPQSERVSAKMPPAISTLFSRIFMDAPNLKLSLKRLREPLFGRGLYRRRRTLDGEGRPVVLLGFNTLAGGVGQPAQVQVCPGFGFVVRRQLQRFLKQLLGKLRIFLQRRDASQSIVCLGMHRFVVGLIEDLEITLAGAIEVALGVEFLGVGE